MNVAFNRIHLGRLAMPCVCFLCFYKMKLQQNKKQDGKKDEKWKIAWHKKRIRLKIDDEHAK